MMRSYRSRISPSALPRQVPLCNWLASTASRNANPRLAGTSTRWSENEHTIASSETPPEAERQARRPRRCAASPNAPIARTSCCPIRPPGAPSAREAFVGRRARKTWLARVAPPTAARSARLQGSGTATPAPCSSLRAPRARASRPPRPASYCASYGAERALRSCRRAASVPMPHAFPPPRRAPPPNCRLCLSCRGTVDSGSSLRWRLLCR
jgi:hypothetical protein